ncbi:MAG: DUF4937 domain-containing protein [Calditrichaceae bacterium]
MICKFIRCKVPAEKYAGFHQAQMQWSALSGVEGFLFQTGGRTIDDPEMMVILAFWESIEHHQNFMDNIHENIIAGNQQDNYYTVNISTVFNVDTVLKNDSRNVFDNVAESEFLKISDFLVIPEQTGHFTGAHAENLIPELIQQEGLIQGFFSGHIQSGERFLKTSFWKGEAEFQNFLKNRNQALIDNANVAADLVKEFEYRILLNKEWFIISEI